MDYWQKLDQNPYPDLAWNLPEQPTGDLLIIGGNQLSFKTIIRTAEFTNQTFRLKNLKIALPDCLKTQLPPLENLLFLPSTPSGSFANSPELNFCLASADFNLILGDFSKNTITQTALASALPAIKIPTLITRDTIDLLTATSPTPILENPQIILLASLVQLQKLLRAIYYPKVILLSSSLMQVVDTLHKLTLSYPITLITLHNAQILIAHNGQVASIPLGQTPYSPLSIWNGQLSATIACYNLFNPQNPFPATISACFPA